MTTPLTETEYGLVLAYRRDAETYAKLHAEAKTARERNRWAKAYALCETAITRIQRRALERREY